MAVARYFRDETEAVRGVLKKVSLLGGSAFYLTLGLILAVLFRKRRPVLALKAWYLFATVALSGAIANVIKFVAGRPRPGAYFSDGKIDLQYFEMSSKYQSFPSGHAATVFSVAILIAYVYPKCKWPAILIAVMVAMSRVAINKHYPSDVIVGSLLGAYTSCALHHHYCKSGILREREPLPGRGSSGESGFEGGG